MKCQPFEPPLIAMLLPRVISCLEWSSNSVACGSTAGPSLYHLLAILGKERSLARIDRALNTIA